MKKAITYIFPVIIAIIQWGLSISMQFDRKYFEYDIPTPITFAVRVGYLFFLVIAWSFLFKVIIELRHHNAKYQRGLTLFSCYITVMMILMLILWPGTWSWDDVGTLRTILGYTSYNPWQHFLSGYYYDVLLNVYPHPGAIILIQNFIISLCVAYSIVEIEYTFNIRKFKNPIVDIVVKILPFLTPPVLMYQFSGYRMGIYIYLELVMFVMIIGIAKGKKITYIQCMLLILLSSIVICWRTESLTYILFIPLIIFFIKKEYFSVGKKIFYLLSVMLIVLTINSIQNNYAGNENYKIISLMGPYSAVVRAADFDEDIAELNKINEVVDINVILDNPQYNGEVLYWATPVVRENYSKEQFDESIKALVKLSLKYPKPVIKERKDLFISASGITGEEWKINYKPIILYQYDDEGGYDEFMQERGYYPIFTEVRNNLINYLSCHKSTGEQIGFLRKVVWNLWIPLVVLIVAWFYYLLKRQWLFWFVLTSILIRVPIIILTEPAGWLMYFLSFYFLGYVYLIYKLLEQRQG